MNQAQQKSNQEELMVRSINRASRSVRCLPFKKAFYQRVAQKAMASEELVQRTDWRELVFAPFGESRAEDHFIWLIKLGILRREVDGQGLTKKVRLTPLGEEVIGQWIGEIPRAGIRERIYENFLRHKSKIL
ncbi:MAG: Npun_F0494 family protein [Cyanobacteriota bacterium]|jgi:hypothetical protein